MIIIYLFGCFNILKEISMDITGIQFLEDRTWDGDRKCIVFYAQIGRQKITCAVSGSALNDYYRSKDTKAKAMENYRNNTKKIHHIAKRLIDDDFFDDNNEIFISSEELV